jgi:hypothetical protein
MEQDLKTEGCLEKSKVEELLKLRTVCEDIQVPCEWLQKGTGLSSDRAINSQLRKMVHF